MPPFLCMKNFTTNFSKYRSVPLRFLLLLGEKKIPTEKSDDPLLIHKFFNNRTFWNHKGPPYENFLVLWDKKYPKNRDAPNTPPPPITSYAWIFSLAGFSKQRSVPLQLFRHCTTETFRRKNVIAPQFLSISCFFHTRSFGNTKVPSNENFWYRETKVPNKPWCPPPTPMHETFHNHIFFRKTEGFPLRTFSALWDKIFSTRETWYPPFYP